MDSLFSLFLDTDGNGSQSSVNDVDSIAYLGSFLHLQLRHPDNIVNINNAETQFIKFNAALLQVNTNCRSGIL